MPDPTITVVNASTGAQTAFPYNSDDTVSSVVDELVSGGFLHTSQGEFSVRLKPSGRQLDTTERLINLQLTSDAFLEIAESSKIIGEGGKYKAEISRAQPTCILFVVDQSGSMDEELEHGVTKAKFVADVLNRSLMELVVSCRKPEGVLHYFDIGVISYGSTVGPGFGGTLSGSQLCPIGTLAQNPIRVESRKRKVSDGAGGVVETEVKFPVWFDPQASGGTPMCSALRLAGQVVADWCRQHPSSFPPTVLHITDGEASDGQPTDVENAARQISSEGTADGKTIFMNLHVSPAGGAPIRFPSGEQGLPHVHAQTLFRISSVLPTEFQKRATNADVRIEAGSRGYVYNGRLDDIVKFFEIGTRPRVAGPER